MKTTSKNTKKKVSHSKFWTLLKQTPNYNEAFKDVIKEGVVNDYSNGKTCSLSEMYAKYPDEYSRMIDALKGSPDQRRQNYDEDRDMWAKRVIRVVCNYLDKSYQFKTREEKIRYVKIIACNAANCSDFNKIPISKLTAIYNEFHKKNEVNASSPATDLPVCLN